MLQTERTLRGSLFESESVADRTGRQEHQFVSDFWQKRPNGCGTLLFTSVAQQPMP